MYAYGGGHNAYILCYRVAVLVRIPYSLFTGSSAPEILLAIIGIISNNFEAEALGSGTIVGSAAFNLLAISAVCIVGIPSGETRRWVYTAWQHIEKKY